MVTKAIIHRVLSDREVIVKVPAFDLVEEETGEEEVNALPKARITAPPGCKPKFKVNDIVYVCIEDNDLSRPIIMGALIDSDEDSNHSTADSEVDSLKVNVNAVLSEDTSIGIVTKDEIKRLSGLNENAQKQFDSNLSQKIDVLNFMTDTINIYFPDRG